MKSIHRWFAVAVALIVFAGFSSAQTPRIDPAGIGGALLLCGQGDVSSPALERFLELAGGDNAKIVVVIANNKTKLPAGLAASGEKLRVAPVKDAPEKLRSATAVWLMVESAAEWRDAMKQHRLHDECQALLKRGGALGAAGAGAELIGNELRLLPAGVVEARAPDQASKLAERLQKMPGFVGYPIDPGAAMLIKGRTISAVGAKKVVMLVAGNPSVREFVAQGKTQQDLTALRRCAIDRVAGFPPKSVEAPVVEKGTLVIVGGGGTPAGLYKKFVEYAGGAGKANIVIFPTASDPIPKREVLADIFRKAGAKKATVLYGKTRTEVESAEFLNTLKEATGLWFDGGRQWRFVDCYEQTNALPLMFDVLRRGGVIGGTSAGATIQGDYLCRGGVFNNFDIRYEGYERGLGFLKGVAIDQHFAQRKRLPEMTQLMKVYPQYLGIGIDEATAIVVQGSTAEVLGKGKVHFYDAKRKFEKGNPDYEAISAGGGYELKERKILPEPK
ncbi:MAG: cyanophycinase [Planctomycetes bacterium]|nr:cyanophycinase [Planctomycetota bacterium]